MNPDHDGPSGTLGASYPRWQLARALAHAGPLNDASAQVRVSRWTAVLAGLLDGSLAPGQRQPVAGFPTWVTLEVATGGFATGAALSAGALRPHEEALLREIGPPHVAAPRLALNRYHLSDDGLQRLTQALHTGRYALEVPEEGALLVVAWLLDHGRADEARALLDTLAPHMDTLRFYPALTPEAQRTGPGVVLETVRTTAGRLRRIGPRPRVLAQREALSTWTPLYDRLVALFLTTVQGPAPVAQKDARGAWLRGPQGQFIVEGGWPCAVYPAGWHGQARDLLADLDTARQSHRLCGQATRADDPLPFLTNALAQALAQPASLTGRAVGRIRLIVARYVAKRGLPGSPGMRQQRERQRVHATRPTHQEIASLVCTRLAGHPQDDGLADPEDLERATAPVLPAEAPSDPWLAHGAQVPASIVRKLERCMRDSIDALVARGLISSGEVLAQMLPQLTGSLRAAGIQDPSLRTLCAALYRAFRRRRSLLLLDLQKQVQFEELPWVGAIAPHRHTDLSAAELARQALLETAALALKAFPYALLPNKLIQEFVALARTAGLPLPFTEEVAADIFMGRFSPKFTEAARLACHVLRGSLYARYYRVDCDDVERALADDRWLKRSDTPPPDKLAGLCAARAGVSLGTYRPALNGQVIEQQLILTTHNLAALTGLPGLPLQADGFGALAQHCFEWVTAHLQQPPASHHVEMVRIKNAAYAWRQMVFFLSFADDAGATGFLPWAWAHLQGQPAPFRQRFAPALRGLRQAMAATVPSPHDDASPVFLGWSSQRHWLMPPLPRT